MAHNYIHKVEFYDGSEETINSMHHQMQYPFGLPKIDYSIIAFAKSLSPVYLNGNNQAKLMPTTPNGLNIEPEVVYYKKTKALAIQCHPECMSKSSTAVKVFNDLIDLLIENKLEQVLDDKIPVNCLSAIVNSVYYETSPFIDNTKEIILE